MFSDNAEPMYMARISQQFPVKLPSLFSWLGAMRTDFSSANLKDITSRRVR